MQGRRQMHLIAVLMTGPACHFEQFSRAVVPLLQKRGVFRTEYAGRTLRENLRA